jgi:hypothetical protein
VSDPTAPPPPPDQPEQPPTFIAPTADVPVVTVHKDRWGPGRIIAVVFAGILAFLSLGLLAGGGVALWADNTQRDASGFLTTGDHRFATDTYAIATRKIDLRYFPTGWLDEIRLRVNAVQQDQEVFVGIGPVRAVDRYLAGVEHAELTDLTDDHAQTSFEVVPGGPPRASPQEQSFWDASTEGAGEQTLSWDVRSGTWAIVVMNGDASPVVAVEANLGAKLPSLQAIAIGLLIAGFVLGIGSALLFWVAFKTRRKAV